MKLLSMVALAIAGALVACAGGGEPVIADVGQDKVRIMGNGAPELAVNSKAAQACGLYKKFPHPISFQCTDQYCLQKVYLYACVDSRGV